MNYRNTPFLRIVIPFCIGLILGDCFPLLAFHSESYWLVAAICLLIFTAGWKYPYGARWLFGLVMQSSFLVLGYLHIENYNEQYAPDHFSHYLSGDSSVVMQGMIYDMPVPGSKTKAPIRIETIQVEGQERGERCSGNLLVYVAADSLPGTLKYGDKVLIHARRPPTRCAPAPNPHSFDYSNYLHHQNIHYNAYLKWADIQVVSQGNGNPVWAKAFEYRDRLLNLLQQHFTTTDEYAVASALLVGYKEDLSDEIKTAYAETGSMHALAVSGTHVGLLYVGVLFFLEKLPLRGRKGRFIETVLALLAIWIFTFLTGATASVLRASVMFSTHLVGKMVYRQANIWNVLSASAFGLMVYNPYFLFDAGFQLSYAAVVGMAFFYPLLYKISPILKYKWMDEGWKVLLVGVAAQIGTLPLSLYYFHQFPSYFWLSGWVVVLGGAIFLWAGALLIVLDMTIPLLGDWLGWGLYYMLYAMNQIIIFIQHLPGSVITGIWVTGIAAVVLYLMIAAAGAAITLKKAKWVFVSLSFLSVLLLANSFRSIQQNAQQHLCIYSVNKATLIDLIEGHTRITLAEGVLPKQENYAAQGHRWALGVPHTTGTGHGFAKDTVAGSIALRPPVIRNGAFSIALITADSLLQSPVATPVNAILLSNSPAVSIADCLSTYPSKLVIIDQRNTWKQVKKWKEACLEAGVEVWDIREKGAWQWTSAR